jgi:hypothetical protein
MNVEGIPFDVPMQDITWTAPARRKLMSSDESISTAIRDCARDVNESVAKHGGDPTKDAGRVIAAIQKLLSHPGLLRIGMPRKTNNGDESRLLYYDPNLMIVISNTRKGEYDLPHNHGTWLATAMYAGEGIYRGFRRLDDGKTPNYADLELLEDRVFHPGDVALTAPPPHDIHQLISLTDNSQMVVTGGTFLNTRQYYEREKKSYTDRRAEEEFLNAKNK